MKTDDVQGKVVVITGAGRGLGRAIALVFAEAGAKVAAVSRTPSTLDTLAKEIVAMGGDVLAVPCDVSNGEQVSQAVKKITGHYGAIDVLVNNADQTTDLQHTFMDTTDEIIHRNMNAGFFGTVYFMRECFPFLKESRGRVINFASGAGVSGAPLYFAYAATKEAIRATTRVVAREWGQFGINVNNVCPVALTEGLAEAMSNPQVAAAATEGVPLGYIGTPEEDVAPVVLFLASSASRYITGHTFMVDGGNHIDAGR